MMKAFCLVALPVSGSPLAEAGESLAPLITAAKAARASGQFAGQAVKAVFVFSSEAGAVVCRYRCEKGNPAAPESESVNPVPRRGRR